MQPGLARIFPMSCFRVLLAWLVMAAIPLQGLAAASMLYCGMGAHHGSEAVVATVHSPASPDRGVEARHDHSKHGHGVPVEARTIVDDGQPRLPDAAHKCGVCASCCHSVALTEFPQTVVFTPLPQAEPAEPFVLIHARASLVPDRPPRA